MLSEEMWTSFQVLAEGVKVLVEHKMFDEAKQLIDIIVKLEEKRKSEEGS